MNVFILDYDVSRIPELMCDQHVVKMILETAQLLCSAHHIVDPGNTEIPYKLTHKNHPCAVWTRQSVFNYSFLVSLGEELCKEYTYRFHRTHKTQQHIEWLRLNVPNLPSTDFSTPPQCVGTTSKRSCIVEAYRQYYINKYMSWRWNKRRRMRFTKRDVPQFLLDAECNVVNRRKIQYYTDIQNMEV